MSYKVYPVVKVEPFCDDYKVKVNGEEVELNTARVSKIPFNRRWPGHQRDVGQSEPVQFLSMESDEELTFEITPKEAFSAESVRIRPRSLGIVPKIEDGKIVFTLKKAAYLTVEPFGRNRALHLFVDSPSDYGIDKDGEGVIYFGKGEHEVGTIELHSGQTLYIDEGAVVYGCVKARDAENIKSVGRGILDNSKNKEIILFEANEKSNFAAVKNAKRQHTIQPEYCENLLIDGITIRDSLVYNVRPLGCKNLEIRNVKIIGCWRYNSDGIDMHNCENVHISHCFIRTFDDCVCVKGFDLFTSDNIEEAIKKAVVHNGKRYDTFKNVLVEDCVLWNDWNKALEIGAETKAEEICDIRFERCDVIHSMKTSLDCYNVDFADVHDVIYKDIIIEADEIVPAPLLQTSDEHEYVNTDEDYVPTTIEVGVECHKEYSQGSTRRGKNRNITFENIYWYSDKKPTVSVYGYDEEHKSENIRVINLYHNDVLVQGDGDCNLILGDFAGKVSIESSR